MSQTTAILILLVTFLVMIVLRFPIAYAVAIASIICMIYRGDHLALVAMQMIRLPERDSGIIIYCSPGLPATDRHNQQFPLQ